jgi:hypothetical protein
MPEPELDELILQPPGDELLGVQSLAVLLDKLFLFI